MGNPGQFLDIPKGILSDNSWTSLKEFPLPGYFIMDGYFMLRSVSLVTRRGFDCKIQPQKSDISLGTNCGDHSRMSVKQELRDI